MRLRDRVPATRRVWAPEEPYSGGEFQLILSLLSWPPKNFSFFFFFKHIDNTDTILIVPNKTNGRT